MLSCHQPNLSSRFCRSYPVLPQATRLAVLLKSPTSLSTKISTINSMVIFYLLSPESTYGTHFLGVSSANIAYFLVPILSIFRCLSHVDEGIMFPAHADPFNLIHPALEHAILLSGKCSSLCLFPFLIWEHSTRAETGLSTQRVLTWVVLFMYIMGIKLGAVSHGGCFHRTPSSQT